jgi:hypothetical protein
MEAAQQDPNLRRLVIKASSETLMNLGELERRAVGRNIRRTRTQAHTEASSATQDRVPC